MISSKYKNELWYKCMQSEWPNLAEYLRKANTFLETGDYSKSALNLRNFFEKSIDYIGERENIKSIREKSTKEKIYYNPIRTKLDIMKKIGIIDIRIYNNLQRVINELNLIVHNQNLEDEHEYVDNLLNCFKETIIFGKWFVDKYSDLETFCKATDFTKIKI